MAPQSLPPNRPYQEFLASKAQHGASAGFEPTFMPDSLFPFQQHLVEWAVRMGRCALFEDCGLGKTIQQLVWAQNVVEHTNRPVVVLTPLAVAAQTVREAAKFGIDAVRTSDGRLSGKRIHVINYERLHYLDPSDFGGAVCDESSILKNFSGVRKAEITEFLRRLPYRLLCTATAAPNDYTELGTSAEALGVLGHMDMLNRFFRNDQNTSDTGRGYRGATRNGWRFKGHAELPFWRWVCSWARACRRPSDLGFDDDGFDLPPLEEQEHIVETRQRLDGQLFALPATNFREEREERRRTIQERCEMAAALVADTGQPAVSWCHLNDEGDLLEELIPDAGQVAGRHSDEEKEERYEAFASGELRVLVVKPKIGAWGLNWQHCAHVLTFASHSYEQYYQSVRRCWRFGQRRPVVVDLVTTEGERGARENMRRKAAAADEMFSRLVAHMGEAQRIDASKDYTLKTEVPGWLAQTSA